ncbi:MAG: hypothetical protein CM15mV135_200 [uncultured marine virus]|nr:MAG: hypothetical protein CM15mV135_200 [uncultured marine virus]
MTLLVLVGGFWERLGGLFGEGNATTPQNIDTHFRDVFLDTFHANVTGGSGGFYLKDVFAPRLSDCLIRTSSVGVNLWIDRTTTTDTSQCDVLLENCTLNLDRRLLKPPWAPKC